MKKGVRIVRNGFMRFVCGIVWMVFIVVLILRLVLALVLSPVFIPLVVFCVDSKNFLGYKILTDWYEGLCDNKIEIYIEEEKRKRDDTRSSLQVKLHILQTLQQTRSNQQVKPTI